MVYTLFSWYIPEEDLTKCEHRLLLLWNEVFWKKNYDSQLFCAGDSTTSGSEKVQSRKKHQNVTNKQNIDQSKLRTKDTAFYWQKS